MRHYFTGKELDPSTNLYYFDARYYDPTLGRFTQPDPLIQDVTDPKTLNPYTYARNNPLRLVDPDGRAFSSSGLGSGFGSFGSGLGDLANGFSSWAWSFSSNAFQGFGAFTATSFNASMTGALLTLQDLGPTFSSWGRDALSYTSPLGTPALSPGMAASLGTLANALEWERAGVRLRSFSRAGGAYVAISGSRSGYFPLAPGAYRLDNPGIGRYLNAGAAAGYALSGWRVGLTTSLVVGQDVSLQLAEGGSLLDPAFLGHTLWDVGVALTSAAVGSAFGTVVTGAFDNPAVGIAVGAGISQGVSWFLNSTVAPWLSGLLAQ